VRLSATDPESLFDRMVAMMDLHVPWESWSVPYRTTVVSLKLHFLTLLLRRWELQFEKYNNVNLADD